MPQTPEDKAREQIDQQLIAAGWVVQDANALNLTAGRGIAVREFPLLPGHGEADYLLYGDRRALGVIEAKKEGDTLTGMEAQTAKYGAGLPSSLPAWQRPLPFLYQSTGAETRYTSSLDPDPRSRPVFTFHQPATLIAWAQGRSGVATAADAILENRPGYDAPSTLLRRLRRMPPLITEGMRPAQIIAIQNLERSLAENRPRALVQMTMGSGKTYTAVAQAYRLIKYAGVKRVLFLVDRGNLARQTLREFQQYATPDDGRKFTELYNVQHLQSNKIDEVCRVCITTSQRLYSILKGEPDFDPEQEEVSVAEAAPTLCNEPLPVVYNPVIPIETFDIVITDECHRSIYHLWRQVLEYFDSYLVGLTATPSKQTLGFFNQNLVMEYGRAQGVKANVLFFERKPASETPWTKTLWVYDFRTNKNFTLKTNTLKRADLDEFVACYRPENRHDRTPTWSQEIPQGRWRRFAYEELLQRDKISLDIFWLRDESLEDSANLPEPDVLATEILEDLQTALEQFALINTDLEASRVT